MLPASILTGSSFVMMFPIAIDKAAIAGALLSGIGTLASFLFEPLKRKDRLGHYMPGGDYFRAIGSVAFSVSCATAVAFGALGAFKSNVPSLSCYAQVGTRYLPV